MRPRVAAVLLLVVAAVSAACSDTRRYDPLPVPQGTVDVPATSSTVPGGLSRTVLPEVPGTTTTTAPAIRPGPLTIVGRVDGPDGPVANALVRLERLTEAGVAVLEVPTAPDGTWNAAGVLGGRYRIRAWQEPSLGMLRARVVFVESPQAPGVVLRLERFDGIRIQSVIAPDPPPVGEAANLKVRVTVREVDDQGVVRYAPVVGVGVTLSGTGSWNLQSPNPQFTDGEGSVIWQLECLEAGPQPLSAMLDTGESEQLGLPACT